MTHGSEHAAHTGPGAHPSILWYYLGVLQRRFWIIFPVVVIFGTLGLIRALRAPRLYEADTKLLVERYTPTVMNFERGLQESYGWDPDYYSTQTELARSRAVMEIALEDPEIRDLFSVSKRRETSSRGSLLGELRRSVLAMLGGKPAPPPEPWELLQGTIMARHIPDTHFIEIAVVSPDSSRAALLANAGAKAYAAYHRQRREASLGEAGTQLEAERKKVEADLLQAEQELQKFRERADGLSLQPDNENQPAIERLNAINQELTEVQIKRVGLSSRIGVMRRALEAQDLGSENTTRALFTLPIVKTDDTLVQLRQSLAEAEKERAVLADTYGAQHPLLKSADGKVTLVRDQFRTALLDVVTAEENQLEMLTEEEHELQRRYDEQKRSTIELAKESFVFNRLQNDVTRHRRLLDALVERMREVDVSSNLIRTNVQIVERASVPSYPINAGRSRRVTLSLMIGLLLGIGLAFVFENLDDTVKTPEDLKERLQAPLLGFVPAIAGEGEPGEAEKVPEPPRDLRARAKALAAGVANSLRNRLFALRPEWAPTKEPAMTPAMLAERRRRGQIVVNEPASSVAEAYRGIRTSLFYSVPAATIKTLSITSCRPQEGKTTTCCNLALSIAQIGKRVILIDGDLHRPMMHRTLGLENKRGLTSVLVGESGWQESVQTIVLDRETDKALHVLTAGPTSPNPSELLGSERMKELVAELSTHYDWVMIDTPPVLFVTDASVLSVLCDGVILIVKAGTSTRTLLNRAREQLEGVRASILGTILNNVTVSRLGRHSSSYYSYGYSRYARDYKSLYYASEDETEATETEATGTEAPAAEADAPATDGVPAAAAPASQAPGTHAPAARAGDADADSWALSVEGAHVSDESDVPDGLRRQLDKLRELARHGQVEQARDLLKSLEAVHGASRLFREAEIRIELDGGFTETAGRMAHTLLEREPENPYALYVIGSLRIVRGELDLAEQALVRSIRNRADPEAMNNLAWLMKKTGRLEQAEELLRRAIKLNDRLHTVWDTLGLVLMQRGRIVEAADAFDRALAAAPNDLGALLNAADTSTRLGRNRRARRHLRRLRRYADQLSAAENERRRHLEAVARHL